MAKDEPDRQSQARTRLRELLAGAAGGLIAAVPMAVFMAVTLALLPRKEQYALPPERITTRIAVRAGMGEAVDDKPDRQAATWLAHLAYGAATGSLYPLLSGGSGCRLYFVGCCSAASSGWPAT